MATNLCAILLRRNFYLYLRLGVCHEHLTMSLGIMTLANRNQEETLRIVCSSG